VGGALRLGQGSWRGEVDKEQGAGDGRGSSCFHVRLYLARALTFDQPHGRAAWEGIRPQIKTARARRFGAHRPRVGCHE
jgi:hypothetical protein